MCETEGGGEVCAPETKDQIWWQGHCLCPVTQPKQLKVHTAGCGLQLPDTSPDTTAQTWPVPQDLLLSKTLQLFPDISILNLWVVVTADVGWLGVEGGHADGGDLHAHPAGCLQAWGASPRGPMQEGSGLLHKVTGYTTSAAGQGGMLLHRRPPVRGLVPRVTGHGLFHADLDGGGRLRPSHSQLHVWAAGSLVQVNVRWGWVPQAIGGSQSPLILGADHWEPAHGFGWRAAILLSWPLRRGFWYQNAVWLGLAVLATLNQSPWAALHGLGQGFPRDPAGPVCGLQMGRDGRSRDILGKQWKGKDSTQTPSESKPANPLSISLEKTSYLGGTGCSERIWDHLSSLTAKRVAQRWFSCRNVKTITQAGAENKGRSDPKAAIQKRKGGAVRSGVCSWKTKTTDILTPSLHRRCSVIQKRGRHQRNTTQTPEDLAPDPQAQPGLLHTWRLSPVSPVLSITLMHPVSPDSITFSLPDKFWW